MPYHPVVTESESATTPTVNHRLTIQYDGRGYLGWQRNQDKPTIQRALETSFEAVFGIRTAANGSGRTDGGTHAEGQVASALLPETEDLSQTRQALNAALPSDIRILDLQRAAADFHARDSAVGKVYRYVIWNDAACPKERKGRVWHVPDPLDVAAMELVAPVFVGCHDFASFATRPNFKQKSTVRTVDRCELEFEAPQITITIGADGFLYKMVRNIVRAMVKVGEGRYDEADLRRILAARDRKASPGTAPASGLYLDSVLYPDDKV